MCILYSTTEQQKLMLRSQKDGEKKEYTLEKGAHAHKNKRM